MPITKATIADSAQLAALINSAYRGESSAQGWTTEASMIDGQRIDEDTLKEYFTDKHTTILKNTSDDGTITGCVYLQVRGNKVYLGMLTVSPLLQAMGLGKLLLQAAEEQVLSLGLHTIKMTVITTRDTLIAWYERRGYQKTGEVIPLLIPEKFGILKQPLEMFILEKET